MNERTFRHIFSSVVSIRGMAGGGIDGVAASPAMDGSHRTTIVDFTAPILWCLFLKGKAMSFYSSV